MDLVDHTDLAEADCHIGFEEVVSRNTAGYGDLRAQRRNALAGDSLGVGHLGLSTSLSVTYARSCSSLCYEHKNDPPSRRAPPLTRARKTGGLRMWRLMQVVFESADYSLRSFVMNIPINVVPVTTVKTTADVSIRNV